MYTIPGSLHGTQYPECTCKLDCDDKSNFTIEGTDVLLLDTPLAEQEREREREREREMAKTALVVSCCIYMYQY